MNQSKQVLLLENIHQLAIEIFEANGFKVKLIKNSLEDGELIKKIKGIEILGVRSKTIINKMVLETADSLKAIGVFGIGLDKIDLKRAQENSIAVFNAPFSNTRSVAELAIGEMIMLLRRAAEKNIKLHQGIWEKTAERCYELRGKKLGIVGYGNIGSQLSILAEFMGMEVYFYDLVDKLPVGRARKCRDLATLLKNVDIVSLHVDGRPENNSLIGAEELEQMKDGSYLLNLSRGFVLDIEAVSAYLEREKLFGAAIDVFPVEPRGNMDKFGSILQKFDNVIMTPHIGGSTIEAQKDIAEFVTHKLINYLTAKKYE